MNSQSSNQWSQPEQQFNHMSAIGEQDFADFIDLDLDISALEFPAIYGNNNADGNGKIGEDLDPLNLLQSQHVQGVQQHDILGSQAAGMSAGAMFDFGMPMAYDPQRQAGFAVGQQPLNPNVLSMIPQTPNSAELHGDTARYLQQLDAQNRMMFEQQYHMRKGDAVNFTPLVSPAVTPHENRFRIAQDYAANSGYLSPLVSPALEGQQQLYQPNGSTGSVATASPIDLDIDMTDSPAVPQDFVPAKRATRKRQSSPRLVANGNRIKQSPITKPQSRRKGNLSAVIPPKEIQDIFNQAQNAQASPTSPSALRPSFSRPSSGTDSISPEPSMESIMGPPPRPASAKHSPAIVAQHRATSSPNLLNQPATPASLMQLQQRSSASPGISPLGQSMSKLMSNMQSLDDFTLPEAAAGDLPADGDATPRLSARKASKLGLLSTSSSVAPSTTTSSQNTPLASTVTSPTASSMSPLSGRKIELKPKGSKKRASVSSSSLVSPALRPKISPSIKPLLPENAAKVTDDAHTLFLANRSNYQNLIEGTHVPGVNYPTELSTNLTSKRTSHKIAEQGRRNRINLALQEMLSLLPRTGSAADITLGDGDDDDEKSGKGGSSKNNGSSKAATVESAIDYIKTLQQESGATKKAMEEKEREVETLKKKLRDMERKLSTAGADDDNSDNSGSREFSDNEDKASPSPGAVGE